MKGWTMFDAEIHQPEEWDLMWDIKRPTREELDVVAPGKFYNRIPGSQKLSLKNNLHNHLRELASRHGEETYGFFPKGHVLPDEVDHVEKELLSGKV